MRAKSISELAGAAVAVAMAMALLVACDSDEHADSRGSASLSVSSSASASTGAADRTDLAACQDATCEVEVKKGDQLAIDSKFGLDKLTISSIGQDQIKLAMEGTSGGFQAQGQGVSVSSSCVNGDCKDTGSLGLVVGSPGRINEIALELVSADGDRAVLRLQPR